MITERWDEVNDQMPQALEIFACQANRTIAEAMVLMDDYARFERKDLRDIASGVLAGRIRFGI